MKNMKPCILLLSLSLCFSSLCFSQQYTSRDQDEIAYQAQQTLNMYKDLLNVIAYKDLVTESEIRELIKNSYSKSKNQLFYSEASIIEDNINPSNLVLRQAQDKTIKEYLQYFDLAYEKSEEESIDFYDFKASPLKFSNHLYIKVKYTSLFKGKHKEDSNSYRPVERVAEFRVEKQDHEWKTFITSIVYHRPENPINSSEGNVVLKDAGAMRNANSPLSAEDSVFMHHMQVGEAALAAENLEGAFTAFSEAEKIFPFHQDLRQNLMELSKAQKQKISSVENRFAYAKQHADKAYAARDYIKAKNLYAEALRLRPEDASLKGRIEKLERIIQQIALLESKYAVGEYKEAIKDYNKAVKKDRDNPDYYFGRGKCFEKLNELKEALKDYSKAIELDGNFVEALNRRAQLYTQTRQYHRAVADYTLILSDPAYAADFYPERARIKKVMGDFKGALEDYDAAIRLNPDEAQHYFQKGMIYLSRQKPARAVAFFSKAIEIDPQYVGAIYQRGFANAARGNLQEASADFEKARELGLEEAQLAEINKLALQFYTRAEGAMEEKRYNPAIKSYKEARLISPAFGRAWLRAGDAYMELEDYDNALLQYEKAVMHDPISFAYFKRGLAYQQKGDEQSAANDFNKYIPIGKELLSLAEGKEKGKRSAASLQEIFVEERANVYYALGYAQLMSNQFVDALENLDRAIHNRNFFPKAYFARGAAQYGLEDYKRAVKNMEESIRMGLSEPMAFYSLGKAYTANDQLQDAIYSYSHTIKLDPQHEDAYTGRAFCYKQLEEYALALEDIETAFHLNEALQEDVVLLTQKGLLELYLNMLREANQSFDQALRLDSKHGLALYGKACALAREDKLEASLKMYRRAFQSRQIEWPAIKNDPLIKPVKKQQAFKDLVKAYF